MELAEVVGQLAGLRRFPVRSLGGETPDECLMQGGGLVGDRIYEMVEVESGAVLSAKTAPLLLRYRARYLDAMVRAGDLEPWIRIRTPDGAEVALADRSWIDDMSRRCGRPVRLRLRADAEGDPAPVHLLSVQTVRFLEKQYGGTLEPVRLRSNLLLDLPDARPFEEDRWLGRKIWIGDALLEIVRQCEFCVVPSLDAETPERSPGILNAILRGRGGLIGVNARALTGSRMRLGDPVAIVD
ncbi:MAG: MOSC N-terminal beta barrel domain-containing protein [Thermoanaerobaculia bacterium]